MESFAAAQHRRQRVTHRQVVIVMGVEVEVRVRVSFLHLPHVFDHLQGIQHTERIRQHDAPDLRLREGIQHVIHIVR